MGKACGAVVESDERNQTFVSGGRSKSNQFIATFADNYYASFMT